LVHGLAVACHPICLPLFNVFSRDPAQRAELELFRSHCAGGIRFLDVGAHWGAFSLVALRAGGPDARAVCVEASPPAVRILRRNLELNQLVSRALIQECAAGSRDGQVQMLSTGAGGADYFVVPPEPRSDAVTVRQVALTGLCRVLGFAPTHVKIDVEGFEEEVLTGALDMLRAYRPKLFLELHGSLIFQRDHDPRAVLDLLRRAGYSRCFEGATPADLAALEAQGFNARLFCSASD
jgi:FkbM family methyltransferase